MDDFHGLLLGVGVIATVLYGTSLHEMAHAYVAYWRGDPTPGRHGRLTWNPLPHLDPPFTAILLPILGYMAGGMLALAQTPVDPTRMRRPMRSMVLVSLAGPAANFLWAGLLLGLLWIPGLAPQGSLNQAVLTEGAFWNVLLGGFNLMPFPPLDGYGIVRPLLPLQLRRTLDDFRRSGMTALLVAVIIGMAVFSRISGPLFDLFYKLLPPR